MGSGSWVLGFGVTGLSFMVHGFGNKVSNQKNEFQVHSSVCSSSDFVGIPLLPRFLVEKNSKFIRDE